MKLLVGNKTNLRKVIDSNYDSETSIVLRYRNALQFGGTDKKNSEYKGWLEKTSIREGARIFPLGIYKGVEIFILDESSLMHTKTLKSIDGCISIAKCKWQGYERLVFESGGNTGAALTQYGVRAGLEIFMFIPEENLSLLNSKIFESKKAHLFSVESPDRVKKAAYLLGRMNGFKHVPEKEWRFEASMFRGLFILESMLEKEKFDWFTQTISAAFGPIGIYEVLTHFSQELGGVPRFLGIQQEANCPMFKAWKSIPDHATDGTESTLPLLTKVMYDGKPQTYGTYQNLKCILISTRGDLATISHQEFTDFLKKDFGGKTILDKLKEHEIEITLNNGEVIEKTGMIALAGTLKEIDQGNIAQGERVLCSLTSGISEADGKAKPELSISSSEDLNEILSKIAYDV